MNAPSVVSTRASRALIVHLGHLGRLALMAMLLALPLTGLTGCGDSDAEGGRQGGPGGQHGAGGGRPGGGRPGMGGGGDRMAAAVPVEVQRVVLRSISSYIETNGTLEAENEVDIVARTGGPIVELLTEESQAVRKGQLLARIDADELLAQKEMTRVELDEARLAFERAERLRASQLISEAEHEQATSRFESAKAQLEGNRIQLAYTEIRAPFDGLIVTRYVKFAENVGTNAPLFRISDFDPLLCPIQVPERELSRLSVGQRAHLSVEAWPTTRFDARVLRLSPVIDAATGTVKVTLQVKGQGKLRPGMFASIFLETATRDDVPVVPKRALTLDSIGDTVFVADGESASRRSVELGFQEDEFVEIVSGVAEGEQVIVVGQDGLSDGTPIQILRAQAREESALRSFSEGGPPSTTDTRPERSGGTDTAAAAANDGPARKGPGGRREGGRGDRPDFANMTAEQLEAFKERMRARGMTEEQIDEQLKRRRERSGAGR